MICQMLFVSNAFASKNVHSTYTRRRIQRDPAACLGLLRHFIRHLSDGAGASFGDVVSEAWEVAADKEESKDDEDALRV